MLLKIVHDCVMAGEFTNNHKILNKIKTLILHLALVNKMSIEIMKTNVFWSVTQDFKLV